MRGFRNMAKEGIRSLFFRAGLEVHRLEAELPRALEKFRIDLILDVGANVGQFAQQTRASGFKGRVISFEPLTDAHKALSARAAGQSAWQVHERCAIGDRDGETAINVSRNSVSSSILPILPAHEAAAAESAYVRTETVPLARLDTVAPPYLAGASHPFLKIDTQGFEWQVLDGAAGILPQIEGVLCELSLVPLYDGQRLWREIIDRLEGDGFTIWSVRRGFTDPRDGRTLQIDVVAFRTDR